MSIPVSNVANSQSFGTLTIRLNQMATLISTNVVTTDSSVNGSLTVGNCAISGGLGVIDIRSNTFGGGSLSTPGNLYMMSNTLFMNGPGGLTTVFAAAGNSQGTSISLNTNTLNIANSVLLTGNINYSNGVNVNTYISANSANIGGQINTNQSNLAATSTLGTNAMNQDAVYMFSNSGVALTAYSNSGFAMKAWSANDAFIATANLAGRAIVAHANSGIGLQVTSNTGIPATIGNNTTIFFKVNSNGTSYFSNSLLLNGTNQGTINSTSFNLQDTSTSSTLSANSLAIGANVSLTSINLTIGNNVINTSSVVYGNSVLTGIGANLSVTNTTFLLANALMVANSITVGNSVTNSVINSTSFSGATVNLSTSITIGSGATASVINATCANVSGNLYSQQLLVSGNASISGNLVVAGSIIYTGVSTTASNNIPVTNNVYNIGNSGMYFANTYTVGLWTNTINFISGGSVNNSIYTGSANNATYFNGQLASYYPNNTIYTGNVNSPNVNAVNLNVSNTIWSNGAIAVGLGTTPGTGHLSTNTLIYATGSYQGNLYIQSYNSATGASSSIGIREETGTSGSIRTMKLYDNNGVPYSREEVGNSVGSFGWTFLGQGAGSSDYLAMTLANTGWLSFDKGITTAQANVTIGPSGILVGNASNYVTITPTGGLSGVGLNIQANNSTYLSGHGYTYFANATSFAGAFNGTNITASGTASISGATTSNGVFSTIGSQYGQYVLSAGPSYNSTILRQDSSNFYVLVSDTPGVTWNSLRPFTINLATGALTLDNTGAGSTFGGSITAGNLNLNYITAITAYSNSGAGVQGTSNSGAGVSGTSNSYTGVVGQSNSAPGVFGNSNISIGVSGISNSYYGVQGTSNNNSGVVGISNSGYGVEAISTSNFALYCFSNSNIAYFGNTSGPVFTINNLGTVSSININNSTDIKNVGSIYCGNTSIPSLGSNSLGYVQLSGGDTNHSGLIAFYTPNTSSAAKRCGYIGNEIPSDYILMTAENGTKGYHLSQANLVVDGVLTVSGAGNSQFTGNVSIAGSLSTNGYLSAALVNTNYLNPLTYNVANVDLGTVILANTSSTTTIYISPTQASGRLMITREGLGNVNLVANQTTLQSRTGNFNILNQYGSVSVYYPFNNIAIIDGNI
jgi:hypothetical protein